MAITRQQYVDALAQAISAGDTRIIARVTQVITLAGWAGHSRKATAAGKKEFADYGWQGFDIKIMQGYAKRGYYRTLTEREVAYAQKVYARNPQYLEQVPELLQKGMMKKAEETFKFV